MTRDVGRRGYGGLLTGMVVLMALAILAPPAISEIPAAVFLPLHTFSEVVSIVVAAMVFGITWHSDGGSRPAGLFWLACALLAAALLDFGHALSYQGMPEFVTPAEPAKAIYFWLAARLAVAAGLLATTFMASASELDDGLPYRVLGACLAGVAAVYWLVLGHLDALPAVYLPGQGLTTFKVAVEWLIIVLLGLTAWRLRGEAGGLTGYDRPALCAALLVSILSELCFSLYGSVNDLYSLLGHVFKIVAYGLIHKAVFVANVQAPYRALKARGEELSASKQRFRDLVESSPDWVWEVDARGVYTYASPKVAELLGYAPEEVVGRTPFDFMPAEEAHRLRGVFEGLARAGLPLAGIENVNRRKDGVEVVLETNGVPIFGADGALQGYRGSDRDITARVRGERALAAERGHLRTLVDTIPDLIWLKDRDGVYQACNPTFERFFGAAEADIVGRTDYDFVDREVADAFREYDRKAMRVGGPSLNEEWITFAADGRRALLQTIKTPVRDASGGIIGVLGVARDITALREAEDALRKSEETLNRAQAVAHIGSWHLDARRNVLVWTAENYRIFGVPPGTPLTYETFLARVHPDDRGLVDRAWRAALDGAPYDIEHRLLVGGEMRWVREKADLLFDADGRLLEGIGISQDITERKRAEAEQARLELQLRQAQKMEALGQMTGGIAHDFNNILAAVMGYARLAQARVAGAGDGTLTQYLGNVVAASERARDLIAKMLAYTRVRADEPVGELAPAPLIRDVMKMLTVTIPSSIELTTRIDDATPRVRIEAVDLQQVLVNLVVNARDAIGEVGRIEVGLHLSTEVGGLCVLCQEAVTGEFVALDVGDSGTGIEPDRIGRIFDPFYTTKAPGKGSGLGLSVVQGIVRKAGGHILVHSRPGQGSVFRLLFPIGQPAPAEEPAGETPLAAPASARVWVVDDEPFVAEFLNELLTARGYRVTVFNRPAEALQAFHATPGEVDAVVTDQTMPGMTGGDLAVAMLKARPDLPIFLCTGYSDHMDEPRARAIGIRYFCHKPFDTGKLLAAMAAALVGTRA